MLVMKVNKELTTDECIAYAKKLSEYLGEKVVILDNKVTEFYRLGEREIEPLLPVYPSVICVPCTYHDDWESYYITCVNTGTTNCDENLTSTFDSSINNK